jgi:anoctamin-10/anoctamin-7
VAVRLNNRENHRTDTEYENSLIAKLFVFQFVNSFAALYYTAFIKQNVEGECTNGGCMDELAVSVGTIFIARVISDNVSKYALPRLSRWWKLRQETKGAALDREMSRPEMEYVMETYDEMMGSLQDFANLSIQFGYVALFATAFPLAPILAFLSNCINMVTDGHKLLFLHRRPIPRSAANIGTWYYIFLVITILAVITNVGLIAFTAEDFDMLSGGDVVWVFFGCQYLAFVFMAIFSVLVPDTPYSVTIQKKRTEFLVSKLIEHREDEFIDEDLLENGQDVEAAQIFDNDKED